MAENRAHDFSKNAHRWLQWISRLCEELIGSSFARRAARMTLPVRAVTANANSMAKLQLGRGGITAERQFHVHCGMSDVTEA
jgi:hypothetical protein